jgi:hypothetical protein
MPNQAKMAMREKKIHWNNLKTGLGILDLRAMTTCITAKEA